jgi:hypothetical protein
MSQTTVKAQPPGTGAGRSVVGSMLDFVNNLGGTAAGLYTKYVDARAYEAKQYTSDAQPISSDETPKTVSQQSQTGSGVSSQQLVAVGGGVAVAGLLLYLLLRKK